ncbi:MAG TPA: hypothetical protein VGG70_06145 [Candidatus Cybelea sp.]
MPPLIITSAVILSGCLGGAGMQTTPPAPIPQTPGSTDGESAQAKSGDSAPEGAAEAAPPISEPVEEPSISTAAGGRFLRA